MSNEPPLSSKEHDVVAAAQAYYAKHKRWGSHPEALCNEVMRLKNALEECRNGRDRWLKEAQKLKEPAPETGGSRPGSDGDDFRRPRQHLQPDRRRRKQIMMIDPHAISKYWKMAQSYFWLILGNVLPILGSSL